MVLFLGYTPEYSCREPASDVSQTLSSKNVSFVLHECEFDVYTKEGNVSTHLDTSTCDGYTFTNENSYAYEVLFPTTFFGKV